MPEPNAVRLLDLGLIESWRTQAIYHAIAETMTAETLDTLVVCRPDTPYLCLGYHQVLERVLDRTACTELGLPVYRRRVGGGLTYLDQNQLFYQCIFHETRVPVKARDVYARMLQAPVATLSRLGLDAELRFENEIEVGDRRVAGIGGARIGEAMVVVGNLLFDFDRPMLARVWRAPSESFRERAASALGERLVTLKELLGSVSRDTVRDLLLEEFERALGGRLEPGVLTPEEEAHARVVRERMSSPPYLDLHREPGDVEPMTRLKISARVSVEEAV